MKKEDDALLNEDVVHVDDVAQSSKEQEEGTKKDNNSRSENMVSLPDGAYDFDFTDIVSTQILQV